MSDDERIEYERPLVHTEPRPVLYRPDGTPLRRSIGFALQHSGTFPELAKTTKKKGKKR